MSIIDQNTAKPIKGMTNAQWQEFFEQMRSEAKPSRAKNMNEMDFRSRSEDILNIPYAYHGDTMWQSYCKFINGVLSSIRHGEPDYCFYTYQIAELLRFENRRLRAKWLPTHDCFVVWLQN